MIRPTREDIQKAISFFTPFVHLRQVLIDLADNLEDTEQRLVNQELAIEELTRALVSIQTDTSMQQKIQENLDAITGNSLKINSLGGRVDVLELALSIAQPILPSHELPPLPELPNLTLSTSTPIQLTQVDQTLEEMRVLVDTRRRQGGGRNTSIIVNLKGGNQYLSSSLILSPSDRGEEFRPTIYKGHVDGTSRILGSKPITSWTPVQDPSILSKFDSSARNHIVQSDLSNWSENLGEVIPLTPTGIWPQSTNNNAVDLFYQGQIMNLSRWPRNRYTTIDQALGPTPITNANTLGRVEGVFTCTEEIPSSFQDEQDIYISGFFFWDWAHAYGQVASINSLTRLIEIKPHTSAPIYHKYGFRDGQRFFLLNILSEVKQPGDWYLDRTSKIIYFYPPEPISNQSIELSILPTLIDSRNSSWIWFKDLTLEKTRSTIVKTKDGSGIVLDNVTLTNGASSALSVSGGTKHACVNSRVSNMGGGGISANGGDRNTLSGSLILLYNNDISQLGKKSVTSGIGISIGGVGITAKNNFVHDLPSDAFRISGNNHLVELNEVYKTNQETSDSGAIYMGRSWIERGNIIRWNYIHEIYSNAPNGVVQALYLDDQESGFFIYGNIVDRAYRGLLLGGGRDNSIINNIFMNISTLHLYIDGRGVNTSNWENTVQAQELKTVPYLTDPWASLYPTLKDISNNSPHKPIGNLVEKNILLGIPNILILKEALGFVDFRSNFKQGDPGFDVVFDQNYQVSSDSDTLINGFEQIPFSEIGILNGIT